MANHKVQSVRHLVPRSNAAMHKRYAEKKLKKRKRKIRAAETLTRCLTGTSKRKYSLYFGLFHEFVQIKYGSYSLVSHPEETLLF